MTSYYTSIMSGNVLGKGVKAIAYALTPDGIAFGLTKSLMNFGLNVVENMVGPALVSLPYGVGFLSRLGIQSVNHASTFGLYAAYLGQERPGIFSGVSETQQGIGGH